MGEKLIGEGKISQKDPAKGKPNGMIRKGRMPIKEEGMATNRGTQKKG